MLNNDTIVKELLVDMIVNPGIMWQVREYI